MNFYPPTDFEEAEGAGNPPDKKLTLQWVYLFSLMSVLLFVASVTFCRFKTKPPIASQNDDTVDAR